MPHDPWTLIGWLIVVVILISLLVVPIAGILMLRARRRAVARFEAHRREIDEGMRPRRRRFGD